MNDREFNREWRKQRRLEQIDTNTPRCSCGETDWRCFEATSMPHCVNCQIKTGPAKAERSRQRRLKELGTDRPFCAMCGETDWRCIELHHVAGRKRDSATVPLCANDHLRMTDDQLDYPRSMQADDQLLDKIGHFLLGLADMLRVIAEHLVEFGHALIARAQLSDHTPF
jgi:hypothetical protein